MNKKTIVIGVYVVVAIVLVLAVAHLFSRHDAVKAVSLPGVNDFGGHVAQQTLATGTSTIFAMMNNDGTDRTIKEWDAVIQGSISTSTTLTIQCATSTSLSATTTTGNNNIVDIKLAPTSYSNNLLGTTTGLGLYLASTSPGATGTTTANTQNVTLNQVVRRWPTGTALICTVTTSDVTNALPSGSTGWFAFPYSIN